MQYARVLGLTGNTSDNEDGDVFMEDEAGVENRQRQKRVGQQSKDVPEEVPCASFGSPGAAANSNSSDEVMSIDNRNCP